MNLLFVCKEGRFRSVTAANLFGGDSMGYDKYISFNEEMFSSYDKIFFMQKNHYNTIIDYFPDLKQKSVCLDIPDNYIVVNDSELIDILKEKVPLYL